MKLMIKDDFEIIKTKPGKRIEGNGMKIIRDKIKFDSEALKKHE